jgi:hypothetical protein
MRVLQILTSLRPLQILRFTEVQGMLLSARTLELFGIIKQINLELLGTT